MKKKVEMEVNKNMKKVDKKYFIEVMGHKALVERIYPLIGQAYVTKKRVAIPKDIYDILSKEQRAAVRAILDEASFGV